MNLRCTWNEKMIFTADASGHQVQMDTKSPLGSDSAMTPKQFLVAGVCGCTAMDVVSLLKKFKQPLESLVVDAEATATTGVYPEIYQNIHLVFRAKGRVEPTKLIEAVTLSQTKYCGVSAMVSKAVPITYDIELNDQKIGSGQANFT